MSAARKLFPEKNRYGVFAFGIGTEVVAGRERSRTTLNVFVNYKHSQPKFAVPVISVRSAGRRVIVRPNVVATGRAPRAHAGVAPPFSGLYPGAPIRTGIEHGGVACFIGSDDQITHFLTAGHLFAPDTAALNPGDGAQVIAAARPTPTKEIKVGTLAVNLLDTDGVDAAAVALTDAGRSLIVSDGPTLVDVVSESAVFDRTGTVFRPLTHDFSQTSQTSKGPVDALLSAGPRGSYWVRGAVGTQNVIIDVGDSGSVLCSGDKNEFALGISVGDFQAQSIFEQIGRVLRLLRPTLGNDLDLISTPK
jgi:hypothetical protein